MNELKSGLTCANVEEYLTATLTEAGVKMAPRYQTRSFTRRYIGVVVEELLLTHPMKIAELVNRKHMVYGKTCCIEIVSVKAFRYLGVNWCDSILNVELRTWTLRIQ